jgi:hypothetical protein
MQASVYMLKAAFLSALEYGKHVLDRGGLHDPVGTGPASDGGPVSRKLLAEFGVDAALVGMQGTLARSMHTNDTADLVFGCAVRVEGAGVSPAFD